VALRLAHDKDGSERQLVVDHVLQVLAMILTSNASNFLIRPCAAPSSAWTRAPRLNATFETSVPGLRFIGPHPRRVSAHFSAS